MRPICLLLGFALSALGCGDSDQTCSDCSGGGSSGEGGAPTTAGGGGFSGTWTTLITGDWQLEAFSENTSDVHTVMVDRDIYIGSIRPIAPTGTHHTVLISGGVSLGAAMYASGVDTGELHFPEGVGLRVSQGTPLILQLHLFNTTGQTLTGTSGIEIIEIPESEVVHVADIFLPGPGPAPSSLAIPPNQESSQAFNCTVSTAQTVFAVLPHMHQLGTHLKTTITQGGVPNVVHDEPYDFNHQDVVSIAPAVMAPGDSITTECTWNNTTAGTVGWGESSTTEMCFSILYRYPAQTDTAFCNN